MKKWFVFATALIPVMIFAAGLRIDLQVLGEKLQNKPDHNAQALAKMGIDPRTIDFGGKPWWTFKSEDNLFRRLFGWNPVKQMSDESWKSSQVLKKQLGFSESLEAQAREAAARARLNQQRVEQQMREMER